jgi:hypothetical protein
MQRLLGAHSAVKSLFIIISDLLVSAVPRVTPSGEDPFIGTERASGNRLQGAAKTLPYRRR